MSAAVCTAAVASVAAFFKSSLLGAAFDAAVNWFDYAVACCSASVADFASASARNFASSAT